MRFKDKSLEARIEEFDKIKKKYPQRLPVIVEKNKNCKLHTIDKYKYLVEKDFKYCQFMNVIRKRLEIKPEEAIFLTINGNLASSNSSMFEIYEKYMYEDGFIYFEYSSENTFG
tara:strand:+ start:124 stop:465 length:342 start_codon:yes stop_codon:yes gene_type:complete